MSSHYCDPPSRTLFRNAFCALAVCFVACLAAVSANAQVPVRPVIAHWIAPMPYAPSQDTDSRTKDDIRAAVEGGYAGFALDVFTHDQAAYVFQLYANAADQIGAKNFKICFSIDTSKGWTGKDIVDLITRFEGNSHYFRLRSLPVLSTYRGEKMGNMWWKNNVIDPLAHSGHRILFLPNFDRDDRNSMLPNQGNWQRVIQEYPVADGLFNFVMPASTPFYTGDARGGNHKWSSLEAGESLASTLHSNGKIYMATYMPYYWAVCHPVRQYIEFRGGEGMQATWDSIIHRRNADAVEIVTWNDFGESTYIQPTQYPQTRTAAIPSMPHTGYYELLKYYIAWYHTNKQPSITKDALFYFYRTQHLNPLPSSDSGCSLGPVSRAQIWGDARDVIFITTALTQAAEVHVTSGGTTKTIQVPAGVNNIEVPFAIGAQTFEVWRGRKMLLRAEGQPVTSAAPVENLNVTSGYALSDGTNSTAWRPSDQWKSTGGLFSGWFQ